MAEACENFITRKYQFFDYQLCCSSKMADMAAILDLVSVDFLT
jgi:hypothetical protein